MSNEGSFTVKTGDLVKAALNGDVDAIGHCCHCFNTMNSGIARQIAKTFPSASQVDNGTIRGNKNKLGSFSLAKCKVKNDKEICVFNLYGQYYYNRDPDSVCLNYDALINALTAMGNCLKNLGKEECVIGLPLIGCGLAGGNWGIIEGIIKVVLCDFDVVIYKLGE